jgi:hypothetical protein
MLAGAYAGYWFILAGALEHGALAWIEDRQRQGDDIRHSSPTRRGFPGRVEIVLPKPAFTVQAASRTIAAAGARAVLSVDPLAPQRLTLSLQGEQTVELSGLRRPLHYVGEAEQFDLEVGLRLALRDWSVVALPTPATLTVRSLTMIDDRTGDHFAVAALDAVASRLPEAAAGRHYTLAAGDVTLPASLDFPFGGVLTRTVVDLVVSGSLPAVPTGDDIIVWREAGGVIDVRQFELATGPIRLEGEGTLALDSSGQPIGAMTIEITGYHAALDTLIVRGIIAVTTGLRLKQIFAVLAGGSVNPNKSVRIPLTLQERVLSAGPIPLIELPFVAW